MSNRRQFIKSFSAAAMSPFFIHSSDLINAKKAFMASLNPGAISLQCTADELLDYAIKFKFSSISPPLMDLIRFNAEDQKAYLMKMHKNGIVFDSGGLPIEFRASVSKFKEGCEFLKENIDTFAAMKIPSFVTWIMPTHKTLTYIQNFKQHQNRLHEVAAILENAGLKLGLEYVGPKTLMARDKHPFLHSAAGLRELIEEIGKKNVGYLLDSFHAYCAEDKNEDFDFLNSQDIIAVQINDGVLGRTAATQQDLERELPGDTKIIDIESFLNLISSKGYNGPVSVEPFNDPINKMEATQKLEKVRGSLLKFGI